MLFFDLRYSFYWNVIGFAFKYLYLRIWGSMLSFNENIILLFIFIERYDVD